ncbi:glycosyltransferase family 4 protein [Pseudomonas sp. Hp2]|uniref:glycosyltransferase family 4 protein n=1 Tax=Pseudomonas sp. Hp2 TaxID=701189 RepID=UPI00112A2C85|nr:glycosyltransferase family 4 protein [Pseudomonas sp. Hp2]
MRVTWLALEWPRTGHHSGGVGRYAARLAGRTARLVDLTVVTYEGAKHIPGIHYVLLPAPNGRISRYYISAVRARAAVHSTRPDVIHAHGDDFLLGGSVPIVRTFYGSSLSEARASRGLRRANHYILGALELWSARCASARLGIAPETIDLFDCEELFPPFLGTTSVAPRQPATSPTIVFIGSFCGRKQGWLAQQAVAHLREHGHPDARLVVIGPQDDAARWEPWVEHRSGLSDTQVSMLLSTAWLLVSPSSYEGFGIPIVEALAHEVAVVALRNPGSEYIHSQANGVAPLQLAMVDDFVVKVESRIRKGPLIDAAEIAGAQIVVTKLTYAGSPERLLSIYENVLSTR